MTERDRKQQTFRALCVRYGQHMEAAPARKCAVMTYYRMFKEPPFRAFMPPVLEFAQGPAEVLVELFKLKPKEAIEYMKAKGYNVTSSWKDQVGEAHRKAFTVAKATKMDVLKEIRGALQSAIENGTSLHDFKKELTPTLEKKGFFGVKEIKKADGTTEIAKVTPSRLNNIFRTNVQSAYNAGRSQQMNETIGQFPFRQFLAINDDSTTDICNKLNGKTFRSDDEFWKKYTPPLHFQCRSTVRTVSEKAFAREGLTVHSGKEFEDANDITHAQGFDYNPAQSDWQPEFKTYDPDIAYAAKAEIEAYVPPPPVDLPEDVDPVAMQKASDKSYARLMKVGEVETLGDLGELLKWSEEQAKAEKATFGSMDHRDIGMVRQYTEDVFHHLNKALMKAEGGKPVKWADDVKSVLSNALMKGPKYESDKHLHRGIRVAPDEFDSFIDKFKVGSEQTFHAFTSTSVSEKVASEFGNVRLRIAKHSGKGVDISGVSMIKEEEEVLLAAGTKYRVTNVTRGAGNVATIDIELL